MWLLPLPLVIAKIAQPAAKGPCTDGVELGLVPPALDLHVLDLVARHDACQLVQSLHRVERHVVAIMGVRRDLNHRTKLMAGMPSKSWLVPIPK
jgi:hypothetical protein